MKFRALRYTLLLIALFSITLLLRASLPTVATGTWVAAGNLSAARSGACTVVLSDGRLLISGGRRAISPTATADLFSTTGSWSAAVSMNSARSHQSCAVLQDGRVLVAGGTTSGGGITNSAEIYDPSADSWAQAGVMNDARSGATVSVLQDGRVLIAGGQSSGGALNTLEIFDPNSGNFSNAGTTSSPRQDHAAAVLSDGRVIIIGGSSDGTNTLPTTDIYDPQAGSVSAGPAMSTPRAKHTATTLLDGTVVVIGGTNGTNDLASVEFFDPAANNFNAASSLATARSKFSAFLLPNNNEVLVVGGQSAGTDLASAELYIPWQKAFQATGAMATPRSDATGATLTKVDGRLLIAGGSSASAELYGFATVKTDAADYPPGTTVTITGSGWQPGETVTLTLVESPLIDTHGPFTTVADAFGNISNNSFVTDAHDLSIRFYLTASGSQAQAQNTFTDKTQPTNTITGENPASPSVVGQAVTVSVSVIGASSPTPAPTGTVSVTDGTVNCTVNLTQGTPGNPSVGSCSLTPTTAGAKTLTASYSGDTNYTKGTDATASYTVNKAGTTTSLTSSTNPSVSGQTATLTATVAAVSPGSGTATGTVTFKDGLTTLGTGTLNAGVATFASSTLALGAHSITAVYGGDTNFTGSTSSTLSQVVNQASTTTTVTSSANPSVFGQGVTFTATVAAVAPGSGTATGTVTFKDGATTLGTGTLSAGQATFATSSLTVATHSITAVYGGDPNFVTSTSSALSQAVNQASTGTSLTSSPNPSVFGQTVNFTVTVSAVAPCEATPAGAVKLKMGPNSLGAPGTLSGGQATIAVSKRPVGANGGIKALYNGDTNFSASQTQVALVQNVNQASTSTSVVSSSSTSTYGQAVTFTATIAVVSPGAGTPTGTVTFNDGATTLGTGSVSTTGGVTTGTFTTTNTQFGAGTHSITAVYSGDASFNTSTSSALTQTVNKATVTATVAANNKVYDGTTAATQNTCTLSGVLAADSANVTCSAGTLNFVDKNVGTGKTVNVSGISLSGSAAGNYQLSSTTATTTANITARPITVTAATNSKTYDGTTSAAPTPTITNGTLATGDTGSFTDSYASKNVGTGLTLIPAGSVSDGNGGNNYAVTLVNNTAGAITARAITVTAATNSKPYDGTTSAAAAPTITSGTLASGDAANFTESYSSANAGTGLTLVPSGSVNDSNAGNNYAVNFVNNTTGVITPVPITVTPDSGQSKVYGSTDPALTYKVTSGSLFTGVSLSGALSRVTSENVGTYTITQGTLTAGSNYNLAITAGVNFTITARPITVTPNSGQSKVYGNSDPVLTYAITSGSKLP